MPFTIPLFLFLFQPLSSLLYWLLARWQPNAVLLAISMVFYWWGEPRFIAIVLASAVLDYVLARRIASRPGQVLVDFLNRRMPAYLETGLNWVHVRDVAAGHILAAEKGRVSP